MGFRFRRSVRIAPGLRLNLSKSGASVSVGGRGATLNVGKKGLKATYGIPGTGISYQTKRAPFHPQGSNSAHINPDLPSSSPRIDRLTRLSKVILWTFGGIVALISIIVTNTPNSPSTTNSDGRPAIAESIDMSNQVAQSAPLLRNNNTEQRDASQVASTNDETVAVVRAANIRSGPGTNNPVVGIRRPGDSLHVVGRAHGWVQVQIGHSTAWIAQALVK